MDRKDGGRLTVHIQAVVSDPFLPTQGLVAGFAAQRCTIVFTFHWDTNGVGHAERLAIVLLRHSTWIEKRVMRGIELIDLIAFNHVPASQVCIKKL